MKPTIAYCHGSTDEPKQRRSLIADSCDEGTVTYFNGAQTPASLIGALGNVSRVNQASIYQPVVLFIHISPFLSITGGGISVVQHAGGEGIGRIFVILVSGGGVNLRNLELGGLPRAAKTKGFGGFSYWPRDIDHSKTELKDAMRRVFALFSRAGNELPAFDAFHAALLPEDSAGDELCGYLSAAIHGLENLAVPLRLDIVELQKKKKRVEDDLLVAELRKEYFGGEELALGYLMPDRELFSGCCGLENGVASFLQLLWESNDKRARRTLAKYSCKGVIRGVDLEDMLKLKAVRKLAGQKKLSAKELANGLGAVVNELRGVADKLRKLRKAIEKP